MACQFRRIYIVAILAFIVISEVKGGSGISKSHAKHKIQCNYGSGLVLRPHPTNCKKFYICYTKNPLEAQCPDGHHFDKTIIGTLSKCVPAEQSKCKDQEISDDGDEFIDNGYFDEDGEFVFDIDIRQLSLD